jgi:multicomponent Na+:H+ antiporter subunit B
MLGTLALTVRRGKTQPQRTLLPVLVICIVGATLVYGTFDMPSFSDPAAPVHQHVAPRYLREAPQATGVSNVVTAVLASYRGYDTLGEVTVIFTAGIGVLALLGYRKHRKRP